MENLSKTGKEYKLGIAELHVLAHVGSLEKRKQYINISQKFCDGVSKTGIGVVYKPAS